MVWTVSWESLWALGSYRKEVSWVSQCFGKEILFSFHFISSLMSWLPHLRCSGVFPPSYCSHTGRAVFLLSVWKFCQAWRETPVFQFLFPFLLPWMLFSCPSLLWIAVTFLFVFSLVPQRREPSFRLRVDTDCIPSFLSFSAGRWYMC